jgi:hypothetical protein
MTDIIPGEEDNGFRRIEVVRDATFHRAVADTGLVVDLGRDMEISFLQSGPSITARKVRKDSDDNDEEGYELSPIITEVARVRINRPSALVMALMVIENLAESRSIKRTAFLDQIRSIFEKHDDPDEE